MDRDGCYLLIGRIRKAHGIKGEVDIHLYSGDSSEVRRYKEVLVSQPRKTDTSPRQRNLDASSTTPSLNDDWRQTCIIRQVRTKGKSAIISLEGINDRTAAEGFAGWNVWVPKKALPFLEQDQFYWHEIIGLQAVTSEGRDLGVVKFLFETNAHDVLVIISENGTEYLIPAINEFIGEINLQTGKLVVLPVDGLLEMNDQGNAV